MNQPFRTFVAAAATIVAASALAGPAAAELSQHSVLSTRGLGSVHIGATVSQVQRRLGHTLEISRFNAPCGTAALSNRLRAWGLFTGTRIYRISTRSPRIRTSRNVRVGDSVSHLLAQYPGRLKQQPAAYTNCLSTSTPPATGRSSSSRTGAQ